MLQKTIPYAIFSGAAVTALSWLAQGIAMTGISYTASSLLFFLANLSIPLSVSFIFFKLATARGTPFSSQKDGFLRGFLPILAGISLLTLLSDLLFDNLPLAMLLSFYASPSFGNLLVFQLLTYGFLLFGSWLLLSSLDRLLWHIPVVTYPARNILFLLCIIVIGSTLQALLTWASVSRWAGSNDLFSLYEMMLPEAVFLPALAATQQLLSFLSFYLTGLIWAIPIKEP